jgi:hypothetical protein
MNGFAWRAQRGYGENLSSSTTLSRHGGNAAWLCRDSAVQTRPDGAYAVRASPFCGANTARWKSSLTGITPRCRTNTAQVAQRWKLGGHGHSYLPRHRSRRLSTVLAPPSAQWKLGRLCSRPHDRWRRKRQRRRWHVSAAVYPPRVSVRGKR